MVGKLVLSLVAAALPASPYPVVAHLGAVPVRAPGIHQSWGACPFGAQRAGSDHAAAEAAVAALPAIARRVSPALDLQGARVIQVRVPKASGDVLPGRVACRGETFARSLLVRIELPHERLADLRGNPAFYVARTPAGWIVWDQVH
jgi:hypothetical protein